MVVSNPANARYWLLGERLKAPSEVAFPLSVKAWLLPVNDVGLAIDCTSVPDVVYSSRKTAVDALVNAPEPVPTLTTTMFPAVKFPEKPKQKRISKQLKEKIFFMG